MDCDGVGQIPSSRAKSGRDLLLLVLSERYLIILIGQPLKFLLM